MRISTRCCRPTGRFSTFSSRGTWKPSSSMRRPARFRAASRSKKRGLPGSRPKTRFSSTVKGSTSMKCWWTMPMPARMASVGLLGL